MSYNIVFVGNHPSFDQELKQNLNAKNIKVTIAPNLKQLTQFLQTNYKHVHLVIIAIYNDVSCTNTILSLQTKHLFRDIPFVVVGERNQVMRGLALGAKDYVVTPCSQSDFISRILVTLESLRYTTSLTTYNTVIQMTFKEYFLSEVKRAERGLYDLSMIFFSLVSKGTNTTNDEYQLYKLVKQLSSLIHSRLRSTDTVIQYGALNIVGFLPFTSKLNAKTVAEKIERLYKNHLQEDSNTKTKYQLIYSIVAYPHDGDNPDDLLFNAEQQLEKALAQIM